MNILVKEIKPENILLDKKLTVKLCDFGWCSEITREKKFIFCLFF